MSYNMVKECRKAGLSILGIEELNGVRYTIKNLPNEAAAKAIEVFICKARFCLR